ncbi:hypothetical protein Golomagni_00619 [Golovinomyces magnicellulatus]|nr:hypothetical protein Golomagni_00619 [Golovinomyces magnicellulatus]
MAMGRRIELNLLRYRSNLGKKTFTCLSNLLGEVAVGEAIPTRRVLDPNLVTSSREERQLMKLGISPIGSRRRRAAIKTSENIPFEKLPYLCFQEARKVLLDERERNFESTSPRCFAASWWTAAKILNDTNIHTMAEVNTGDMNKPIYRHLACEKWKGYHRKILVQRIEQFAIVPDLLPTFEPKAAVNVAFRRRKVQPGDYVDSRVSEVPARLKVQVFDKGERLISVVMIDADVPMVEIDNYVQRCHFLAVNIQISPTQISVPLSRLNPETQVIVPWLPPFAQKGSEYHRYSIFVLEQEAGSMLDLEEVKKTIPRDGFSLQDFISNTSAHPVGLGVFRSIWDEGTAGVMHRASIEGAGIVFKRKKVIALKPKEKPRGWDARRAHPKYDVLMGKNRRPFKKILRRR